MKQDVICKLCNKNLGNVHGYQVPALRRLHVKAEHPKEYAEWELINHKRKEICNKLGIW